LHIIPGLHFAIIGISRHVPSSCLSTHGRAPSVAEHSLGKGSSGSAFGAALAVAEAFGAIAGGFADGRFEASAMATVGVGGPFPAGVLPSGGAF
jgi:hypothetical protein